MTSSKEERSMIIWKLFIQKKMESNLKADIENHLPPDNRIIQTPETKFFNNEDTYEGYGKQKSYGSELSKRQRIDSSSGEQEFFQSLSSTLGPHGHDQSDNILDILTVNFSGVDRREVCQKILKLTENSLQSSGSPNSPGTSNPNRDALLRLQEFLVSYLEQDPEAKANEVIDFDVSPRSRHSSVSANDSLSSLGILDVADISSILNDSLDYTADQSSVQCDTTLYLNQIEELLHQNKKLNKENELLKTQISSLEDLNQLLNQSNINFKRDVQSLNASQKEIKELHCRIEHSKTTISALEGSEKRILVKIEELEKEKALLEKNITYLGEKLSLSQSEADQRQIYVTELTEALLEQKIMVQNLYQKKDDIEAELHQKKSQCQELELAVNELTDSNQCLRSDKNSIEAELENTRNCLECALEKCSKLTERLHSLSRSPEAHLESTDPILPVSFYEESICVEMSSELQECQFEETLPTPLCGKQNVPLVSRIPLLTNSHRKIQPLVRPVENGHSTAGERRKNFSKQLNMDSVDQVENAEAMTAETEPNMANRNVFHARGDVKENQLEVGLNAFDENTSRQQQSDFNSYLQSLHREIHHTRCLLEGINSQAKHVLATEIDIAQLEKKLLEAKGDTLALELSSKVGGDSSMPPHGYSSDLDDNKRTSDASSQVIRDQISAEIKALKTQLIRSHALLSYLQEKENCSSTSFSPDASSPNSRKPTHNRHGKIPLQQQKSLDAQTTPFFNFSQKDSTSNTSHRSTPLHTFRSQSCPLLLDELPFVSKSTQTGLAQETEKAISAVVNLHNVKILSQQLHANRFVPVWNRTKEPRFSECSSTSEMSSKSADNLECGVCEVHPIQEEALSPCLPRHRTNSFLSAVVNSSNQTSCDTSPTNNPETSCLPDAQSRLEARRKSLQSRRVVKIAPQEDEEEKPKENQAVPEGMKKDSCDPNTERRNEKEKFFKTSQRSMRRGSGAGSPNSMTSIPRFPAFDLDEQDEDHALSVPSPKGIPETNIDMVPIVREFESSADPQKNQIQTTKENVHGKHECSKAMLMPETVENSETESAKGSFEYESLEIPSVTIDGPPLPVPDMAFPNLPNTLLMKLGISKDSTFGVESFDDQELESKFMTLSLAFKTDKMTLSKRIEIQKRQRDIAEKDVENEIKAIKDSLNYLNLNAITTETRDLIAKIQTHVDIVSMATSKVSARSETYGAVKQEERVSCAFEVMMHHVENLRRLFDKEHRELEETKTMLSGSLSPCKKLGPSENATVEQHRKSLKTFGLAIGTVKAVVFSLKGVFSSLQQLIKVVRRRASVADFQHSFRDSFRPFSQTWTSGFKETASRRISALLPFSSSSSVGHNSTSSSTHNCTPVVQSSSLMVSQAGGSRRCSLPASHLKAPLDNRAKDGLHSQNEMKISVAPTLSSVADEEHSGEEEESVQDLPTVPKPELTEEVVQESTIIVQCRDNSLRPRIIPYFNVPDEMSDSSDDGYCNSDVSSSATKEGKLLLQRCGYYSVLRFWNETSSLNLFRYFASLFLAIGAFIVFVMTFLPSDNCSAYDSLVQKLSEFMFRTSPNPPVV